MRKSVTLDSIDHPLVIESVKGVLFELMFDVRDYAEPKNRKQRFFERRLYALAAVRKRFEKWIEMTLEGKIAW
jgi:hypothetical protein